jgi:hypothetical protein
MRKNAWIDDFIKENGMSFAVLMSALEKKIETAKQKSKEK